MLLSVADHHGRTISRGSSKRVIGVLLGQDLGKTINVANSFGIPFEEDERDPKTWFLDHNYIEGMYSMFKKVNGKSLYSAYGEVFHPYYSSGTNDWVVPFWSKTTSIRSRYQRPV